MTPPLLASVETLLAPGSGAGSDTALTPTQLTHLDVLPAPIDERPAIHYPEGHPDAPQAEASIGSQANVRSTPLRVIASRAYREEEQTVAQCDKEIERLTAKLYDEQKSNRDNPNKVHELMTGSAAERIAAQEPFRLTREAIVHAKHARDEARRRGAAALRYALNRAKQDKLDS